MRLATEGVGQGRQPQQAGGAVTAPCRARPRRGPQEPAAAGSGSRGGRRGRRTAGAAPVELVTGVVERSAGPGLLEGQPERLHLVDEAVDVAAQARSRRRRPPPTARRPGRRPRRGGRRAAAAGRGPPRSPSHPLGRGELRPERLGGAVGRRAGLAGLQLLRARAGPRRRRAAPGAARGRRPGGRCASTPRRRRRCARRSRPAGRAAALGRRAHRPVEAGLGLQRVPHEAAPRLAQRTGRSAARRAAGDGDGHPRRPAAAPTAAAARIGSPATIPAAAPAPARRIAEGEVMASPTGRVRSRSRHRAIRSWRPPR